MHLAHYIDLLQTAEERLAAAYREVGGGHPDEADVLHLTRRLAAQCDKHAERLEPFARSYRDDAPEGPEHLHSELFRGPREGPLGLIRDLHDLYLMAAECDLVWTLIAQAAQGARDEELLAVVRQCDEQTRVQLTWLKTRIKQAAPQALVVA